MEHPQSIDLTPLGVVEDRRFFLADELDRLVDRLVIGELVRIETHTNPDARSEGSTSGSSGRSPRRAPSAWATRSSRRTHGLTD